MIETNLFIYEFINNNYSHLMNILVGLTKKDINLLFNNIITIIVEDDTIPLPIAKYFNRIYIRPMRDIDVLVNPEDILLVVELAKDLNFKFINNIH